MAPPLIKCQTKILHPNISSKLNWIIKINNNLIFILDLSASGDVCLSILRLNSIDGTSWLPTRRLRDVMFAVNSIFTDLCDFSDTLNVEISEEYEMDMEKTKAKIREYVQLHAR